MKYVKQIGGLVISCTLLALAMENPLVFVNIPSLLIVGGLTVGGLLHSGVKLWSASFWRQARQYAIGSGFVGTLVGLVLLLGSMDDPAAIGPSCAVALLTLLYGTFFGYFIALPNEKRKAEEA